MAKIDYVKILNDIHEIKFEIRDLDGKITDLEKDIRGELEYKVKEVEWEHTNYDRRISLTEKVVFGAVGIILVTVIGALLAKIII